MTVSNELILYSRADCHLCDLVAGMLDRAGVAWRSIDIEQDADLERIYGLRIPVLKDPRCGKELFFPFNEEQLSRFIRKLR